MLEGEFVDSMLYAGRVREFDIGQGTEILEARNYTFFSTTLNAPVHLSGKIRTSRSASGVRRASELLYGLLSTIAVSRPASQ